MLPASFLLGPITTQHCSQQHLLQPLNSLLFALHSVSFLLHVVSFGSGGGGERAIPPPLGQERALWLRQRRRKCTLPLPQSIETAGLRFSFPLRKTHWGFLRCKKEEVAPKASAKKKSAQLRKKSQPMPPDKEEKRKKISESLKKS